MVRGVSRWLVALLALAVVALSAYLLTVGAEVMVSSDGAGTTERDPMVPALIPLLGGMAALVGAWRVDRRWMLGGGMTVLIFGILFIFGAGPHFPLLGLALFLSALVTSRSVKEGSVEGEVAG